MGLWQDARFAVRLLVKDKWFTLVAAVALALGIGVNNTVFTFVNAVLIRGLPFNDPDREAGQVIFSCGIEPRHLGSLAPDECAARLATAVGNAGNDGLRLTDHQFSDRQVVQKKQWLGSAHSHIVRTHGNKVDSHGSMSSGEKGNF